MKRLELAGKQFNRLLVIGFAYMQKGSSYWNVKCDCGNVETIKGNYILSGHSKSCGCLVSEKIKEIFSTHGFSHGTYTQKRFYKIWKGVKVRCNNENCKAFPYYGGRGIKLCKRWDLFENFRDDMYGSYLAHVEEFGEENTSLDRIDSNGNYKLSNCKWSTDLEQKRNRRTVAITEDYLKHIRYANLIQGLINRVINTNSKHSKKLIEYVGCDIPEFKQYIQSLWEPWMNWDNHGNGVGKWNIDHIIPIYTFDLSKEKDRKECFHYTNLRPLEASKNKARKIDHKEILL